MTANRPRLRLSALILAVGLALAGALAPPPDAAQAAKPKRIVALTPFAANTLAKLGIKPVAIGIGVGGDAHLHRKLRNVPELPLSHASNGPNLEQLVTHDPDLVLSERTWRAGHEAIRELEIDVKEVDPTRVAQVPKRIRKLGKIVGRAKRANRLAAKTQKKLKRARRGIRFRPRVLMILGVGQTPYAFLPSSWGGDLVSRAGANLITDGLSPDGDDLLVSGGYAQLSDEEILARNPDVIIAVPHGRADDVDAIADELREDETLAATNAGQNDRLFVTTDNRLLQASTDVAQVIKLVRREYLRNR